MKKPPKAFITYSHENADKRKRLEKALAVMVDNREIEIWHDAKILPGDEWEKEITENLKKADILLYLVSADSLASKNCNDELSDILSEAPNIQVVPIVLEDCDFLYHPLTKFEALPTKNKNIVPISRWRNHSQAWQNVVEGIRKTIANIPCKPKPDGQDTHPSTPKEPQHTLLTQEQAVAELFNHANFFSMLGNDDLAIASFKKAIDLNPNYAEAYYNRGNAYNNKDNDDRAIADYTKAIALNLNIVAVYINRGIAYRKKGDYVRAIADYSKAIDMDPNYPDAYNNRGNIYSRKGDYNLAIADFNKSIKLDPNYAVYNNRGVAKKAMEDFKGAKKDFQEALRLAEQHGNKHLADDLQKKIDNLPDDSD